MKRRSGASVVAGEGGLFDACVATLAAFIPPAHHHALAEAIAGRLGGDGCVRVARAMHRWQLVDDRTLALLAHLSHHFPAEEEEPHRLDLTTCTHLSEEALIETASLWRHLTAMTTPRASDELLRALSRSAVAQTLDEVSLSSPCNVTLQGLHHLSAFPNLRKLSLGFKCEEQAIGVLGNACPQLEELSAITYRMWWTADLFALLPNLKSLHDSRISLEALEQLHVTGRLKHFTSLRGCEVPVDSNEAAKALIDLLSDPGTKLIEGPTFQRTLAFREIAQRITSQQQQQQVQQGELATPHRPTAGRNPFASWTGLVLQQPALPAAGWAPVLQAFPALRKLEIDIDNQGPSLQSSFGSIAAGFEALPHLNELFLTGFRCDDAASIAALLPSSSTGAGGGAWRSSLAKLTLHSACLSGAFIAAMAHGLPGLTSLDLQPSPDFDSAEHELDESLVKALSERDDSEEGGQPRLAKLRSLTLRGFFAHRPPRGRRSCSGADETGICRFHLQHPQLEHLVCGEYDDICYDEDYDYDDDERETQPQRFGLTIECARLRSCEIHARDMHSWDLVRTVASLSESSPLLTTLAVSLLRDFDADDDVDGGDGGDKETTDQQPSWIPHALHRLVSACPLLATVSLTGQPPAGVAPSALQPLPQAQAAAVAPMDDNGGGGANIQQLELSGRWSLSPLSMSGAAPAAPPVHDLLARFSRLTRLTLSANCTPANSRDDLTPFAEAELHALALLPSLETLSIHGVLSGFGDDRITLAVEGGAGADGVHRWPQLRSVEVGYVCLAAATIRHLPRLEKVGLLPADSYDGRTTPSTAAPAMSLALAHCPRLAEVSVDSVVRQPAAEVRLADPPAAEGTFAGCPALRSIRMDAGGRMRMTFGPGPH